MKKIVYLENERGFVLVAALLMLVVLSMLGTFALNTTTTELNISGNEIRHKVAFYAAESGIAAGRAVLNSIKEADTGYWDKILSGTQITFNGNNLQTCTPTVAANPDPLNCESIISPATNDKLLDALVDVLGDRNLKGGASFSLLVRDNDDLDNTVLVDTDNSLILTSTGINGTARSTIETLIRYTGNDQYAQEYYNTENTNQAGSGNVQGQRRL